MRPLLAAVALVAAIAPVTAHAVNLIGETLSVYRYFPDKSTNYGVRFTPQTVTVEAGPGDNASWGPYAVFKPEATSITLDIQLPIGMLGGGETFDGFAVSGFSFTPSQAYIATNTVGGLIELTTSGNTVYLDFVQNYPDFTYPTGSITVAFQSPVPEPATWGLLAAGVIALAWRGRGPARGA